MATSYTPEEGIRAQQTMSLPIASVPSAFFFHLHSDIVEKRIVQIDLIMMQYQGQDWFFLVNLDSDFGPTVCGLRCCKTLYTTIK